MITAASIAQILSLYRKHGWNLRRVLLSDALKSSLAGELENLFGAAPLVDSDFDAVWFSRPSRGDQEAWELRRLADAPFALFETFDADDEEEIRDEALGEIENRMRAQFQSASPKRPPQKPR